VLYQPGIGPHPETQAVELIVSELQQLFPDRYSDVTKTNILYPAGRKKCDLCIGASPSWEWAVEIKMLRLMGDNGKPNDNMLMHILSPYPANRSALTDCVKLLESGLGGRKGAPRSLSSVVATESQIQWGSLRYFSSSTGIPADRVANMHS
jgi:hypothetical protein